MTLVGEALIGVPICLVLWIAFKVYRYNTRPLTVAEQGAELAADLFVHQFNRFTITGETYSFGSLSIKVEWVRLVLDEPYHWRVTIQVDGVLLPGGRGARDKIIAHIEALRSAKKAEGEAQAAIKVARAVQSLGTLQ